MSDWAMVRLEDLAANEKSAISKPYGSAIVKEDYRPDGVPVVRGVNLAGGVFVDDDFVFISEELADSMPGARLEPGDLVFTHRGSIGQVSMIPRAPRYDRYAVSTSQVKARLDQSRAVPEFYYYWFKSPLGLHSIMQGASTVGVPGLAQPVATIKALRVPEPPLEVQAAIAATLGSLDEKIASNRRAILLLEEVGACVLATALGPNPDLCGGQLGDVLGVLETGARPRGGAVNEGTVSLGAENVRSAGIGQWSSFKRVPEDFAQSMKRGHLADEDVMIYKDGAALTSGAPIVTAFGYGFPVESAVINEHVYRARVSAGPWSQALLYWLLKAPIIEGEIRKRVTGAAQPGLNSTNFKSVPLPAWSDHEVVTLGSSLSPLLVRMLALGAENRRLAEMRDSLLPDLMRGRVRPRSDVEAVA